MEISKQSRMDIVRGEVTDYAIKTAEINVISTDELIKILKEIAETLKK